MLDVLGQALIYVVPFLLVLTVIVTIHELGHFWAARAFGVKVDRFSIGFGRAILSRRDRHGIEWRLAWLPLGGYVKFAGDLDASSVPDRRGLDHLRERIAREEGEGAVSDYFHFKPVWQRALIVAAGPFANFVLAVLIFTVLFSALGVQVSPPRVAGVSPDGAAAAAGFAPRDLVVAIDGRQIEDANEMVRIVSLNAGEPLAFQIERDGQSVELIATPTRTVEQDPIAGRVTVGRIGLQLGSLPGETRFIRYDLPAAVGRGVQEVGDVIGTTFHYLGRLLTGRESGDQLSGPLGIAKASGALTDRAVSANPDPVFTALNVLLTLVQFAAILSIGIGFINLMPIPVLDGGHLVFYGYEAVAGKPVAAAVQEAGYRVGLALVAALMLFATWNDLQKMDLFRFLGGLAS